MKKSFLNLLAIGLVLFTLGCARLHAWPAVVFNPTNGVILIPTNFVAANLAGVAVSAAGTATNLTGNATNQVLALIASNPPSLAPGTSITNATLAGTINSNLPTVIGSVNGTLGTSPVTISGGLYDNVTIQSGINGGRLTLNGGQGGGGGLVINTISGSATTIQNGNLTLSSGTYIGDGSGVSNTVAASVANSFGSVTVVTNTVLLSTYGTGSDTNTLIVTNSGANVNYTYYWTGTQYTNASTSQPRGITNNGTAWFLNNRNTGFNYYWITNANFPGGTWNNGSVTNSPPTVLFNPINVTNVTSLAGGSLGIRSIIVTNLTLNTTGAAPASTTPVIWFVITNGTGLYKVGGCQ